MTESKRELKLSQSKDWDAWLSVVRAKATGYKIWDLVDPSKSTKPKGKEEPTKPDLDAMEGDNFTEKHARYKMHLTDYKRELQEQKEQEEAMAKIISFIYDTTSVTNLTYIQKVEIHPWDVLRALQARLAPSDSARSLDLEQQYYRLAKGPSNRQNVDNWLDDYIKMYTQAKEADIAEVTKPKRAYRDFLHAIENQAPTFAEVHEMAMSTAPPETDYEALLFTVIEQYRHHARLKESKKGKSPASNSAFAADENKKPKSGRNSSFRGEDQSPPPCVCGQKHWFTECSYLNEDKRSTDWKPNATTQKKVDEALKDPKKQGQVERSLARYAKLAKSKDNLKEDSKKDEKQVGAFPIALGKCNQTGTFASQPSYALRSSWVMDHGSSVHVANDTMRQRFIKEEDCTDGSTVVSGNGPLPIVAYGRMNIKVDTPTGKSNMTLLNVAYVPDFMVNIVSGSILEDKGLDFDTQHRHLHRNGAAVVLVSRVGGHYVLENNKIAPKEAASFTTSTRASSTQDWHQLLAHANNEAIQHLTTAAEGVELTDKEPVPKTNKCEECALSKAHKLVSRSPDKSETSDKPFFRINFDLIAMTTAMNKDQWISHIACYATGFHMIYTHPSKAQATETLIRAIHTIETRYGGKVVFVRSDGERALGTEWDTYTAAKGITYEPSAVDTPAQNGHSERMGGILLMKSRAMRIQAGLPVYLWPWVTQTAGYIMNRTPLAKHSWKTPFEMVTGKKPNLAHLIKYGAKAYPIDKAIPKREKMRTKAHIGFLVGYDSTNIYLIWIPSQRKVIRTRDVTFNEDSFYRPHEIDAAQLISEPFLTDDTIDIPQSDFTRIIEVESESDSDEELGLTPTGTIESPQEGGTVARDDSKGAAKEDAKGYLPSPAPSSSRGEDTPTTSPEPGRTRSTSPSAQLQTEASIPQTRPHPHFQRTLLSEDNVLPEGSTRIRKPSARRQAYLTALEEAPTGGKEAYYGAFMASIKKEKRPHRDELPPEPKYYHQMLKHPEASGFQRAIDTEVKALQAKNTWKTVPYKHAKEAGRVPIPTTWVFKYKFDTEGYLIKHKARLCARGDLQQTSQDVYAATLAIRVFRALMAIVTAFNMNTRQYDAVNAFANSEIDEPTYCKPPDGWKGDNELLLLLRALYGLKQSPALWYRHLSNTLNELGLEQVPGIECLFINDYMLLFFFVDDIVVLYHSRNTKQVDKFEQQLFNAYEMRNMGEIEWFLGIRVTRDRELYQMSLCQDSYIDKLTSKFNVNTNFASPGAPLTSYIPMRKNEETATLQQIHAYQQRVGSINFAAVTTRPDVSFAASKLSEFLTNPSSHHLDQAGRVLRYLAHTKNYAIVFDGQTGDADTIFLGSSDASFADDVDTRQSSNGYCFKLYNGLIDWKANKQRTVTTSSTEAELLAMSMTANTKMWWDRFFEAIQLKIEGVTHIECDNKQTIRAFTKTGTQITTKLRHVDIHRHWLRQEVQKGTINIRWTPTTSILADGLTKMLPPQRHAEFIKLIGLQAIHLEGVEDHEDLAKPAEHDEFSTFPKALKEQHQTASKEVECALNGALNND